MPQVLIVDDRAINRELLVMLLRPARYETLEASSGEEALVMALEHHPDAVILDQTTGMDGLTLVKTMRENRALDDIAIIFYTAALSAAEVMPEASRLGIAAVLPKPAESATILATLDRVLPGGTAPARGAAVETGRSDVPTLGFQLAHLVEIGLNLAAASEEKPLVEMFARQARAMIGCDLVAVKVRATDGWMLHLAGDGLSEWPVIDGSDPQEAESLARSFDAVWHRDVAATLISPPGRPDERVGAAFYGKAEGQFDETAERLASTLSSQLTLAWENLRLRNALLRTGHSTLQDSAGGAHERVPARGRRAGGSAPAAVIGRPGSQHPGRWPRISGGSDPLAPFARSHRNAREDPEPGRYTGHRRRSRTGNRRHCPAAI